MAKDYAPIDWDDACRAALADLLHLAVREDLDRWYDWTSVALVADDSQSRAAVVSRGSGVLAGLPAAGQILAQYSPRLEWTSDVMDGASLEPGTIVGHVAGPTRALLAAERVLLNFIGHLAGIATLTRRYADAVAHTRAKIYDTRKTLPGFRLLEKYAVRVGGGHNHRSGLHASVLIKDNHLAAGHSAATAAYTPAEAVTRARSYIENTLPVLQSEHFLIEIEVDTLAQLVEVLPTGPDVVLLDNMTLDELREAVACRDRLAPQVELEASGGVRLERVAAIAETGVERISAGAITHSAPWFDVGLDWQG